MKKFITVSLTGIGLIAIALAIYFKKGEGSHSPLPCYSDNCCLPDPSERPLFYPDQKEEVCKLVNSNFILNMKDTLSYQTFYISLEEDENYIVSARVHETVEIKGEKKIKALSFLLLNSEDSYYHIAKIKQPKRSKDGLRINIKFKKGKCTSPFIPRTYKYVIKDPKNYIKSKDIITHDHEESELDKLCAPPFRTKSLRVGGHLCQVAVL
jgi:hypothetical protein